ncbi:MAG: hypothetical protein BWY86_01127 [Candidatus Aminicenantes bacterium ADurb.Bin508]|nr:MAG: hypothetical protein BWY86_01127 [Candidatus Aminicenantes bacterium ADurb.Bin508]
MLYPLVDGKDREETGSAQSPVVEEPLQVLENADGPVGGDQDPFNEIGTGQVEQLFGHRLALMAEKGLSLFP